MLERLGPVVGSVFVVALLVLVVGMSDDDPGPERPPVGGEEAVAGFLAAYERSWQVEVVVEFVTTRVFPDGRELAYEHRLVQRPPDDRLVIGAGSANGRIDGQIVRCATVLGDDQPRCTPGGAAGDYDDELAGMVAALADMLAVGDGLYEVSTTGGGCYDLLLRLRTFTPPYGVEARFCFDEGTGVLASVDVVRPEATERTVATEIRLAVTAADLRATDLGEPLAGG